MGLVCQNCGKADNDPAWEFCGACGMDLEPANATVSAKNEPPSEIHTVSSPVNEAAPVPASAKPKLSIMSQGKILRTYIVEKSDITIGRWDPDVGAMPDLDLTEEDTNCYVSRHHSRLFARDGRYYVEDLGGKNPTRLNRGNKLSPHTPFELRNGDEIIVGKLFLRFTLE